MEERSEVLEKLARRLLAESAGWRGEHPKATLFEIEMHVEGQLDGLRREMIEELVEASRVVDVGALPAEERPRCAHCGGMLVASGREEREVQTMRGSRVRLRRSYARCSECGAGLFPP